MGVSFKISKTITRRHKPKPMITESTQFNEKNTDNSLEASKSHFKDQTNCGIEKKDRTSEGNVEDAVGLTGSSVSSGKEHTFGDDEVSFSLNLYPDGYYIVKASENDNEHTFKDGLKHLRPYDRTSEGLFSAIESGRLPGGILDDIPCKFVEGATMCEVRDYRKCVPHCEPNISSPSESAIVSKVSLKMSLENIVKDIPLMADDSWTYGDLMEVESRILNALQPKLCLDPVPRLDRLCQNPASKIDLGIVGMRKRLRQIPEVTVTSNNRSYGKKICIGHASESSIYGDIMSQHNQENVLSKGPSNQRTMYDPSQGPVLPHGVSSAGQNIPIPYANDMNLLAAVKIVNQESQLSTYSNFNKRGTLASSEPDGLQHQQDSSFMDGFQRSDMQGRNPMLQPHQNPSGVQYGNPGMKKYPQLVGEEVTTMDGMKLVKAEPNMIKTNTQLEAEGNHMDPRVGWNNLGQQIEKDPRKEDQFSKRKSIQTPRLSAEMSYGSMSTHYGPVSSGAPLGQVQREKSRVTPVPAAGRASSGTSLGNDPMQYQHQAQLAAKRRPNSLPRTPAISGVGSPVSVNTMGAPLNASSPSISTPQLTEHDMLERFAKIQVVAMRHQLNRKKNKVDAFSRKPRTFAAQELLICLSGVDKDECTDDSREMSKSVLGGHMNVCKIRLVRVEPGIQGNMTRLILSEKPNDGTVAMHYGDLNNEDYQNSEDHLPTLPNTHWADLLADQFCALIIREGYVVHEHLQLREPHLPVPSDRQSTAPEGAPNHSTVDAQQYTESVEGKPVNSNNLLNAAANVLPSSGMLPPGNSQPLQMSQGHVAGVAIQARPQQMDPQQPLQQQPHQHQQSPLQHTPSQFQRPPLVLPNNSVPQMNSFVQGSNLPVGNHMSNKSSLQMLQQPNQQAQRRLMMGLGTAAMGMGQVGNNMGLGGLNNAMGIGGGKGMGSAGIPTGVGPLSGVGGNMVQSPIGLSHSNTIGAHLRAGTLSPQVYAAAAQRYNIMRNRGMLGGAQSGIAGMSAGTRQMQSGSAGLSMLGQSINRGTIGQMQRSVAGQMAHMGMPNLMPGMNAALNQHQFQQLQQQPRQNVLPQQEAMSPLQSMVSPQQVSSPSTMGHPQQMNQQLTATPQQQASPQQMSQRGPMSPPLSSGPVHPMSADACPASPALSSQTPGSVGNIPHSPMDLHGVNKSNSATNT